MYLDSLSSMTIHYTVPCRHCMLTYFDPFLANDCDLFLHIMLALRYYHSMMLRGDQSLYEIITIAQRLLLADMPLDPCVIQEFSWGAVK